MYLNGNLLKAISLHRSATKNKVLIRVATFSSVKTGTVKWDVGTRSPMVAGVLATGGGLVFTGDAEGYFSAYDADSGKVLWEYNSAHEFTTVNGIAAKGGSLNGPGPVIVGGMLFMNSGYAYLGYGAAGNVLLAFGVE